MNNFQIFLSLMLILIRYWYESTHSKMNILLFNIFVFNLNSFWWFTCDHLARCFILTCGNRAERSSSSWGSRIVFPSVQTASRTLHNPWNIQTFSCFEHNLMNKSKRSEASNGFLWVLLLCINMPRIYAHQ